MNKHEVLNCIDIARPYITAVTAEGMPPVQLLGGIGSVALLNEATVIKPDEKRIIAPANLMLNNYRDDGNLRDIETLVLSSDIAQSHQVEECAKQAIGNKLIIEVFGFKNISREEELIAKPLGFKALTAFVSDRYMQDATVWGPNASQPKRMLFPFSAPISADALETWTLEVDDKLEVPVSSPGATIINYLTRSISGLRGKDSTKVQQMSQAIFEKSPQMIDWIRQGPGKSQYEMARIFHTLREPKKNPEDLLIGDKLLIKAMPYKNLLVHPNFMLKDASKNIQKSALKIAAFKSRGLHYAESMDFLVTLFQRYIEPRISSIIHNN